MFILAVILSLYFFYFFSMELNGFVVMKKIDPFLFPIYSIYILPTDYVTPNIHSFVNLQENYNTKTSNMTKINVTYFVYHSAKFLSQIKKSKYSLFIQIDSNYYFDYSIILLLSSILLMILSITIYKQCYH